MIALVGAMFVALPSVSAQSTTYYCTSVGLAGSESLRVTNEAGTTGYVLTEASALSETNPAENTLDLTQAVSDSSADPCGDVDSDVNVADDNGEDAVDGDILIIGVDDKGNTEASDDTREWVRVYAEALGPAKNTLQSDDPNELLTDNPENRVDGSARPQSMTITFHGSDSFVPLGDDNENTADKVEVSDRTGEIILVSRTSNTWKVTAAGAGTATVKITENTPDQDIERTYTFEVKEGMSAADQAKADAAAAATAEQSVTLEIDDTDDTVGNAVTAWHDFTITTKNIPVLPASVEGTGGYLRVFVSGELEDAYVSVPAGLALSDGIATYTGAVNVPKGTTPGEYTLDVTIYSDGSRSGLNSDRGRLKAYSSSDVLIVGDAGMNVSEAVLVLSPLDADGAPVAEGTSQKTQPSSSAAKGDPIRLTLTSLNALGNASNPWINVTVTAAGAKIRHSHSVNAKGAYVAESGTTSRDNSLQLNGLDAASIVVEISKDTPGAVEVSALVVDPNGSGYDGSDTVNLTFTGPAKTVSLSDATTTLLNRYVDHKADDDDTDTDPRDNISLKLTASDADGHAVVPTGNATVTIAGPDGSMVATDGAGQKIVVSQKVAATTNTISLRVAASVTAANPLKSGEYTVTAKDGARKDTAMFTVVGLADTVSMEASEANEDGLIEVTVTVTDADGNPVADGTVVSIQEADLRGDDDQVLYLTSSTGKTKAGEAKATFIEIGPGRAAIIAMADGKSDVVRVTSTFDAPEPEAMPEEEASVACLSELSGFATWSCGVEADASEIFDMVSGRGVTALHLWNGSTWVRYSVVDGAMVPGSSDFMVTKSDILYISN